MPAQNFLGWDTGEPGLHLYEQVVRPSGAAASRDLVQALYCQVDNFRMRNPGTVALPDRLDLLRMLHFGSGSFYLVPHPESGRGIKRRRPKA
jgi:hypothetical protein